MTGNEPPLVVERLALDRTIRLVTTARRREAVLLALFGPDYIADGAEIEGATSGRLVTETYGGTELSAEEMAAGISHANFINAAFAYWRPRDLNRFNGPNRGAWYAALAVETCLAEVTYHLTRELERIKNFDAAVDYVEMFSSFAGEFADLRSIESAHNCLNPDPAISYSIGNAFAETVRRRELNGIIYPSVRHEGGTCLVALRPNAVQSVAQGDVYQAVWHENKTLSISKVA